MTLSVGFANIALVLVHVFELLCQRNKECLNQINQKRKHSYFCELRKIKND